MTKIKCWHCHGTGREQWEEGPAGATWTCYRTCPVCRGAMLLEWKSARNQDKD